MTEALRVYTHWSTDEGLKRMANDFVPGTTIVEALRTHADRLEQDGSYVVRLLRVYTQRIPLVDGKPCEALAGPLERVPEGAFHIQQEMLT